MMNLKKLNNLDYDTFMNMFGNVIEHCPLVAASIWNCRPFSSANEMMFGYRYLMQRSAVEVSIIENVFNMDNSTDVAFQLAYRHQW